MKNAIHRDSSTVSGQQLYDKNIFHNSVYKIKHAGTGQTSDNRGGCVVIKGRRKSHYHTVCRDKVIEICQGLIQSNRVREGVKAFRKTWLYPAAVSSHFHLSKVNGMYAQSRLGNLYSTLATADHTYSTQRLCSRTPASTVLYRTGHSVMNYSFAVVLFVSESVKDIFRLHACLQDSSLFPHFLIATWPSTTADYGSEHRKLAVHVQWVVERGSQADVFTRSEQLLPRSSSFIHRHMTQYWKPLEGLYSIGERRVKIPYFDVSEDGLFCRREVFFSKNPRAMSWFVMFEDSLLATSRLSELSSAEADYPLMGGYLHACSEIPTRSIVVITAICSHLEPFEDYKGLLHTLVLGRNILVITCSHVVKVTLQMTAEEVCVVDCEECRFDDDDTYTLGVMESFKEMGTGTQAEVKVSEYNTMLVKENAKRREVTKGQEVLNNDFRRQRIRREGDRFNN
ncbi:hypothetical protein J6590_101589 [Homalodisca vitripennis]|nr:hypothetical protein J6590_085411 [Homalodisca vitripennis]KAG8269711.1 hypothetical protein J6590_101589 [Homalodisca vitripennis]